MNFSFGLLKPDCLRRGLEKSVYNIIEANDLKIIFKKRMSLNLAVVQEFYYQWKDKDFFEGLCEYMLSGEVEAFIVEGDNAIKRLEEISGGHGATGVYKNTIRGRFATSVRENIIHATTNEKTFKREAKILLEEKAKEWIP